MGDRRDELLQQSLAYLLENGVAGLSLRPLAAALGTSARLLVYHFGSKDALLEAALAEVRAAFQASFLAVLPGPGADHPMRAFWKSLSHPTQRPYLRLLLEVQVLALQSPDRWGRYLNQTSSSWLEVIESAMPPSPDRRATATLCAAVIDGLILELLSTGDEARTTQALDILISNLNRKGRP